MQQLAVLGHGLRPRHFIGSIDIGFRDLVAVHGDDSLADHRANVLTSDAGIQSIDLGPRHPLGVFDRLPDRASRFFDVGDYATTQSGRARLTDTQNLEVRRTLGVGRHRLADHRGRLRRPDVESGNDVFRIH